MGDLDAHKYLPLLLLLCVISTTGERPRMIFTDRDTTVVSRRLPPAPVQILLEKENVVTAIGTTQTRLIQFMNQQTQIPVDLSVEWDECSKDSANTKVCIYNLTVILKRQGANQIFACGNSGTDITCCNLTVSEHSVKCTPSDTVNSIIEQKRRSIVMEGEASAFVESPDGAELYIAFSRSQNFITGIYRFGKHTVRPGYHVEEQHYIELILSKQERENDVLQDKIYGFYNEKNKDTDMYSDMWKSFVTQICVTDNGGPKNNLQSTWTSQLNARLFCGDKDQKQHFSELVDIATVEADHWQDTRVYGLFRNEWGMSAVCVYTIQDINHVFKTSPFKNSEMQPDRSRTCVGDSTKLPITVLKQIEANSEMKNYIEPQNSSGPLLISRHHYTRITAHRLQNHTILFIALHNGMIHKVMLKQTATDAISYVIAEYRPFNHRAFIVNLDLHPTTRTLYIASRTELAQMDVANCQGYGNSCEECIMARDPYCGWSEGQCTKDGSPQDTEHLAICPILAQINQAKDESKDVVNKILIPLGSRYFFECPVSSLHANYTWYHNSSPTVSCSGDEHQCFMLIHSVKPEQLGTYTCVSMEQGYRQVLAQYQLEVDDCANGFTPGALLWVSLIAAFLVQS
ncbi:semaphorin-7A-like isoform X2 [Periophthalmus magnuspinnatus]|uniref:semaphorin-7A-like isoform X2 n=1 Tax=Periophthalmus magnuspinnatus TaxID=409849 RepID=UPI00145B293E|nr:semaphorin-7A-like isoform X2 [Periophthalmus magnuspinnatus]